MSLFGTSPEESAPAAATSASSRVTLFDDEPSPASGSHSSLFADEDNTPGGSPWGIPSPKKASKSELVSTLLPTSDAPDSYVDIFDAVQSTEYGQNGTVDMAGMSQVMNAAKLGADEQTKVMNIMSSAGSNLRRNEFNVFLALVGLAQEGEDITLDGVDERRRSMCHLLTSNMSTANFYPELPLPDLPGLLTAPQSLPGTAELASKPPQRPRTPPTQSIPTPNARASRPRKDSINDEDPWGSPALHKGHNHIVPAPAPAPAPQNNGDIQPQTNGTYDPVQRTNSNFDYTAGSTVESTNGSTEQPQETRPTPNNLWYSYDGHSTTSYNSGMPTGSDSNDFSALPGGDEQGRPLPNSQSRAFGGGSVLAGNGVEENILVTLLPEKEGVFMFQHHNYQVHSPRRGCKVVRRYSDFVWLLDCLHKRYPFRRLPLLPPKRVGGAYSPFLARLRS